MTIQELRDALVSTGIKVCHFDSDVKAQPYIVFAETREVNTKNGDDIKIEQAIQCSVYYVTPVEYDTAVNEIQTALDDLGVAYRLTNIEYLRDIKRIQYTWSVQIGCDPGEIYGNFEN